MIDATNTDIEELEENIELPERASGSHNVYHAAPVEVDGCLLQTAALHARRILYISHAIAQFSEIAFQFGIVLFLAKTTDYESLILVNLYGICLHVAVTVSSSGLGRYLDRTDRWSTVRKLILIENLSVILSTAFCYVLLSVDDSTVRSMHIPVDGLSILSLVGIFLFGALAQVCDRALTVAMERDWIVILCKSLDDFEKSLSATNVSMKQIDLSCKIVAPAVTAMIIPAINADDFRPACLLIGGANLVSLITEYVCNRRIYRLLPKLAVRDDGEEGGEEPLDECTKPIEKRKSSWKVYAEQSSAWGGLGLAILYTNPLTFGNGIMETYLLFRGLSLESVGVLRGVSSAIGLLGTVAYDVSARYFSLEITGLWSVTFQSACLGMALLFSHYTVTILVGSVCLSRIGLWVYDIALTQIQQQEVPGPICSQVGGMQQSLNSAFNLLSFLIAISVPDPKNFWVYITVSFLSVSIAMLMFTFGLWLPRRFASSIRQGDT